MMTANELQVMVGQMLTIRNIPHLVLAAGDDTLLLLQLAGADEGKLFRKGDPVQYIVAHYPDQCGGDLVWGQGEYFPLLRYSHSGAIALASALALRDAVEAMTVASMEELEEGEAYEDTGNRPE